MEHRRHAVVLGASMGGLLAARALSEHFERVTLVERDHFPPEFEHRKGVPQSRHSHGLLSSGYEILERFFPGLTSEATAAGALLGDSLETGRWCVGGQAFRIAAGGPVSLIISRPVLEARVRRRVLALPNVEAIEGTDVLGLAGDAGRIQGVRLLSRSDRSAEVRVAADLVVDATGRGSRLPGWLKVLGLDPPEEERVEIDMNYVTVILRRSPADLDAARVVIVSALPPNRRCGAALAFEEERWTLTLGGYNNETIPLDRAGMVDYARGLPAPWLHELLASCERLGEPVTAKYAFSFRRRFERLERFPRGLLVVGDAFCSFNPIYGQGMSVAALEATAIERALQTGKEVDWRRYFAEASRIIDTPWALAVGNDLGFPEHEDARPPGAEWVSAYMRRIARAASVDATVARDFLRVSHLVAPLSSLFSPSMVLRAWRHGGAPVSLGTRWRPSPIA
jgi:2-polyprenyl-6-methoxyphenol hydroxylase-like FAD-dependent oxidoreductase